MTHGGDLQRLAAAAGCAPEEILDFSANVNPLGPPEYLRRVISRTVSSAAHYPDPAARGLAQSIAKRRCLPAEQIVMGNGSTELLYLLPRALNCARALVPAPSYVDYARAAQLAGLPVESVPLAEADNFALRLDALAIHLRAGDLVFLGHPNNPTGLLLDSQGLRRLAAERRAATFVVDEAFLDFVENAPTLVADRPENVIVLCSMTKFYAVAGLRLGYAVADGPTAARIRALAPPWSLNVFAQAVGEAVLADEEYHRSTRSYVTAARERLSAGLKRFDGLTVYPGQANFLLVRVRRADLDAAALAERLLRLRIAIRVCDDFAGLDGKSFFRAAVRTEDENGRLLEALAEVLTPPQKPKPGNAPVARSARSPRRAATLMFQGTSSNAGKSVLTAALCRILLQDGFRVAPFKAQNMSLNSFVTLAGGEMGRAQAMQAQACRIEPDVRMNPILLKPNSDTGSQVIVLGQPVGNRDVAEYARCKGEAFAIVAEAFDGLAREYDAVVLEGAGSPGEVNLKHQDIVNMKMAAYAHAPVLLVGDIDRGGVFASFVGTMEVLAEWERRLVAGFVVNRFRGDATLLKPAFDYVQEHTGKPVLGLVPYLRLNLPQEDSVEFKSGAFDDSGAAANALDIAVLDLPHISNFTDLDALRLEPDVRLRVVRTPAELGEPDTLILPGSKNVISDLGFLRQNGLAAAIARVAAGSRTEIVGICGGFQMLGKSLADPHGIESRESCAPGLGLLPVTTVLAPEKTLLRVNAEHLPSGLPVVGYEIHHGQTEPGPAQVILRGENDRAVGIASDDHRIWGTYLHGIFDSDRFRRWFLDRLRERRGLGPRGGPPVTYDLEPMFDELAAVVRKGLNMDAVYQLMGLH